jgi:hypothetical protein
MIIISVIFLLLIIFFYSIKDIISLIYYIDILFEIDRSSKNCSKDFKDYDNLYNNKYKKDVIIDILSVLKYKENKAKEQEININSNRISRDLYYFLDEKSTKIIEGNYNAIFGTLLGLFVVILILILLFKSNVSFPNWPIPKLDIINLGKHIWNNGNIYTGIVLYLIAYIVIFSILSDKLKRYNESLDKDEYNTDITRFKNDIEEIRKVIYSHIALMLILVLIIMISYKNIYGDYFYYIAYGISIISIIIIYMSYFAYNEFIS